MSRLERRQLNASVRAEIESAALNETKVRRQCSDLKRQAASLRETMARARELLAQAQVFVAVPTTTADNLGDGDLVSRRPDA
jgi:septal ring factor EnvC (AmiA/AmiB activator)